MGEDQSIDTYEVESSVTTCEPSIDSMQAILEHLRTHIDEEHAEDGICDRQGCHTNMYALTAEVRDRGPVDSTFAKY